jgi:hypothetical protein
MEDTISVNFLFPKGRGSCIKLISGPVRFMGTCLKASSRTRNYAIIMPNPVWLGLGEFGGRRIGTPFFRRIKGIGRILKKIYDSLKSDFLLK